MDSPHRVARAKEMLDRIRAETVITVKSASRISVWRDGSLPIRALELRLQAPRSTPEAQRNMAEQASSSLGRPSQV